MGTDDTTAVYPAGGGNPLPTTGIEPGEVPATCSADSRFLYTYRLGNVPVRIFRVELSTGKRTFWKEMAPPDPVGVTFLSNIFFSEDMKSYVYSINRRLDVLYLVEGLR
jgi:hypothetical protein